MRDRWRGAVSLLAVLLATGCTATTSGHARPSAGTAPAGSTIKQVLLDGTALSKLLNQPFETVPVFPPVLGGSEKLGDAYEGGSPAGCVGVVYMTQRSVYQSGSGKSEAKAGLKSIASESWQHGGSSVKVDDVGESVVSLRSPTAASALFAKFSAQWKQCDGQTVTFPSGTFVRDTITDVRADDSVVAATVTLRPREHSILSSIPEARAIGVRRDCVVEVRVSFFGNSYPSDQGSADINTSAVDIAHAIMDRIGAPS